VLQPPPSIVVRVVEQPVHETTIADVIFGSLGLVGVMLIAAALAGLVLGGGLILFKRVRHRDGLDTEDDGSNLRVTPMS
jgi:ABC-type nitrate/sulfonate/bicarbonate transport system permease component